SPLLLTAPSTCRTHTLSLHDALPISLLEVALETGRTHQIRVHLAYAGYPVAGDPVYGPRRNPLNLPAQALHAYKITFQHPRTGRSEEHTSELQSRENLVCRLLLEKKK